MSPKPLGQAVRAEDVEDLPADSGPTDFVRLCGAVVGAALADRLVSFTLPEITERISVPDGGVDAEYTPAAGQPMSETGGLVGPGRTVYQFKYRDFSRAVRSTLVRELVRRLRDEFPRVASSCHRYVLLTNLHLTSFDRAKLRKGLLDSAPAFGSRPLIVWGAGELAALLNQTPHLRNVFFADGRFCTLDFAEDELKTSYAPLGWWPFVGRDRERAAIASFPDSETTRVLQLFGARYSGKTRLVLEALEPRGTSVVWVSWPDAATVEVFRDLDSATQRLVLVVDRCSGESAARVTELALERRRLKTVVIAEGRARRVDSGLTTVLNLHSMAEDEAIQLLRAIRPGLPFLQQSWITKTAGGLPGLLLHVADLVAKGETDPRGDTLRGHLDSLLAEKYLAGVPPQRRRALWVLSLLPVIGVRDEMAPEVDRVARALGTSGDEVRSHLSDLMAAGLVQEHGRAVEVTPPVLASHLAGEALARPETTIAELQQALEPPAFLRFIHRLREIRAPGVSQAIARLFSPGGWLTDLDALIRNARALRALAPTASAEALRCLERILGSLSVEELKERVVDDARRAIVSTLEHLALRPDTFEGAARLLLALAEAENERWGNNATGVFGALFHWRHPEVAAALSRRAAIVQEGAESSSATRQRIVAQACGEAFSESASVVLHDAEGPEPPVRPGLPQTWDEVREFGLRVLDVLGVLARDDRSTEVKQAAYTAVIDSLRVFVRYSVLPAELYGLGRQALATVEEIAKAAPTARLWYRIATQLELVLADLSDKADQAGVVEARTEAKRILAALTEQDLRARLWRWVGPSSTDVELARLNDDLQVSSALSELTGELVADPDRFSEHVAWLTSEDAEHRVPLFQRLGAADRGGRLLPILFRAWNGSHWPVAFAAYCVGWGGMAPNEVDQALDRLLDEPTAHSGILLATTWLSPSERAVDRLIRLVKSGHIPRIDAAREIARSTPWERLSPAQAEQLLRTLDDGTGDVRSELLLAFLIRDRRGADITPDLRELAWSFLESVSPAGHKAVRSNWDALAARLGEHDPARLLTLVERLVAPPVAEQPGTLDRDVLPRVWRTLESTDRVGTLRTLLRLAAATDAPWPVAWHLSQMIDPARDRELLRQWAEETGINGAHLVAASLNAGHPGFWEVAHDLLARWGDDPDIGAELLARLHSGSRSGSATSMIEERITRARVLANDPNPRVAAWAQEAVRQLEEWGDREARKDREGWIWDYRISRAQLEAMLMKKDTPERLWAIGRLLEDAPRERVEELLTTKEIREALPKLAHLDQHTRDKWETWTRLRSQRY